MQFVSFHHLHRCTKQLLHVFCTRLSGVAAVCQDIRHRGSLFLRPLSEDDRSRTIRDMCGRYRKTMRQSLGIYGDMALHPGYFLASIISFFLCGIRVFHAWRVNDAEACFLCPPIADTDLANDVFLTLPRECLVSLPAAHSRSENMQARSSISDSLTATSATDTRSSRHTARRSRHHTNQCVAAVSSSVLPLTEELSSQIVLA
jgi:hypothetical protein